MTYISQYSDFGFGTFMDPDTFYPCEGYGFHTVSNQDGSVVPRGNGVLLTKAKPAWPNALATAEHISHLIWWKSEYQYINDIFKELDRRCGNLDIKWWPVSVEKTRNIGDRLSRIKITVRVDRPDHFIALKLGWDSAPN